MVFLMRYQWTFAYAATRYDTHDFFLCLLSAIYHQMSEFVGLAKVRRRTVTSAC